MPKFLFVLLSAVSLLLPSISPGQEGNAELTGTVAYRERMALPSDAVINVQLLDTSVADVAAQTVTEVMINAEGRQVPVAFTLSYDPAQIVPAHRYSVRATIRSGDGMLMFSSTQAYPVLTHGAPFKANLILHTVGRGAKAGVTAKKPATPAAPEAAQTTAGTTSPSAPEAPSTSPDSSTPSPQTEKEPGQPEVAAPPPSSAASEPSSAPAPQTTTEPASAAEHKPAQTVETAPPNSTESTPSTVASTEEAAEPTIEPVPASPGAKTAAPESKTAEATGPVPEATTPPESKTEPAAPAPETKASEPEAPLPEAPSASKHVEATPPVAEDNNSPEPEAESVPTPERAAPNKALTPLADTQWKLIQLNGQDVVVAPPQKPVSLSFSPEGRRIAGSAGCNSYLGTFTDDHGRLHLSPGNMTMMFCADPAGSRERKFIAMLRLADGYKISGDFLLLTSNGKTVAKFKNNQE